MHAGRPTAQSRAIQIAGGRRRRQELLLRLVDIHPTSEVRIDLHARRRNRNRVGVGRVGLQFSCPLGPVRLTRGVAKHGIVTYSGLPWASFCTPSNGILRPWVVPSVAKR